VRAVIAHPLLGLAAPIDTMVNDPQNANRGDVAAIRKSLSVFGQRKPVVVRRTGADAAGRPTGIVIAGNHTLMAATELGWDHVAAVFIDDDETTAKAYALADNRTGELSSWDDEQLADTLRELDADDFDMSSLGWTDAQLAALLSEGADDDADSEDADEVDAPDTTPRPDPITQPGDIWQIGPHRIICGDCRDFATVERLLDSTRVNVAFTSPPYAAQRTYDESSGFRPIPPAEYVAWFRDVAANVRAVLADDGSWFVNIKEHTEDGQRSLYVKDLTLAHVREWGWSYVDELIWNHGGFPGAFKGRFKNGYEPVFHFAGVPGPGVKHRPTAVAVASENAFTYQGKLAPTSTGNVGFNGSDVERGEGLALPSNVLNFRHSGQSASDIFKHEAAFPVKLPAWFIKAYSDPGDVIYDPFLGSGTTLVAAHQNERVGYGCEISPGYVDVTCRRLQKATGIRPVLASTGEAHDFLAEEDTREDATL
jgi:DNA modification methylase